MVVKVLVSSAAYSLTDHYSASEGLAAFHIMNGLGKYDVRFEAIAANVLMRNHPAHIKTIEIKVPPDPLLLNNKVLTLATGIYYLARNNQKSLSVLRKEDVDIVHHMFPSNNVNFSLLPLLSNMEGRCPFVFGPVCGPDPIETPYHRIFAKFHNANCRRADVVIVQTKQLLDMYSERFGAEKVVRIPLGVEPDYFEPYEPVADDGFEILTVANLREKKGHTYLIKAMVDIIKSTPNAHLTIVGDGPERPALQSLIDELGLKGHVELAGFVAREELKDYYRRASVFCLPSIGEVFGKVIVEAMACGKPVVATNGPGPRELVEDGRTGFVVPERDPQVLADAISTIASDAGLRASMSARARERSHEYSWDVIVDKYWEVYKRLL